MVVVIVIVVVVVDGRMVVTSGIDVSSSSILGGFWYDIILVAGFTIVTGVVSVFLFLWMCSFGCNIAVCGSNAAQERQACRSFLGRTRCSF